MRERIRDPHDLLVTALEDRLLARTGRVNANDARIVGVTPARREPLWYDPKGFFVITVDRASGEIVVRHYERDYTPAHEMRSHSGEAIMLSLLREELVSQLSHAGYLGRELAKAESALRLGLGYEQDRPLAPA